MAGSTNSREVELKLRVATLGAEGIRSLEEDVRNLAAEGKIAAEAGNKLADEIARMGEAAGKLQSFKQLADEVEQLALASERTRAVSVGLADDVTRLSEATAQAAKVEQLAREQLEDTRVALQAKRDEQVKAKNDEERATRTSEEHTNVLRKLRLELNALEQQEREHAKSLQTASEWAKRAAADEGSMQRALSAATKEADANAAALRDRNEQLRDAASDLRTMGVATDDAAASEIKLSEAFNQSRAALDRLKEEESGRVEALRQQALEEERLAGIMIRARNQMTDAARAEADGIVRDFDRMKAAEKAAADEAQRSAAQIKDAFSTVGKKSVAELTAEIERVKAAMNTLRTTAGLTGPELDRAMAVGNQRIKTLERDIREATGQLTIMDRVSSGLKTTLGQFAAAFGAFEIGSRLAQGFLSANVELEKLRLGLGTVYKNVDITSKQIDFLRSVADSAGVSVSSISQSFVKFAASMSSANIPLEQSNALFAAVTQAAGTLGLSGDKVSHMLDALSQMAGKGTVSLEELRQQLGDSLPGAMGLVAKGLGITEAQLIKLVETGQLAARDLFPALTKSLQQMSGQVDTLSGRWERFKNVLTTSAQSAGDSGWVDVMKGALAGLAQVVALVVIPLQGFFEVMFGIAKAAAVLVGAVATLSNPMEALGQIVDDAATRLGRMRDAFDGLDGAGRGAADSGARAGQAAGAAGTAADGAAGSVVKLRVAYADLEHAQALNIELAEKQVKGAKQHAQALQELAKLRGDDVNAAQSAMQGALGEAAATEKLAVAKSALVDTLTRQKTAMDSALTAQGLDLVQRTEQLKLIDERLQKAVAEADVARTEADAARITAAAREIAVKTIGDQSREVDRLREAMVLAQAITRETQLLEVNGKKSKEDVTRATVEQAKAEALYADAVKDAAAAAARRVDQLGMEHRLKAAGLELSLAEAKAEEDKARALGNTWGVRQAQIKQREIEIQLVKMTVATMLAEADAADIALNKRIEDMIVSGQWTEQKAAELSLRRQEIEIKRLAAEANRQSIAELERELKVLRNGTLGRTEHRAASDSVVAGIKGEIGARGEHVKALAAETQKMFELNKAKIDEINNRNRVGNDRITSNDPTKTADGFTKNKDGSASGTFNNTLPTDMAVRLRDTQGKGMTDEEIAAGIQQAENLADYARKTRGSGSSFDFENSVNSITNAATVAKQTLASKQHAANSNKADPNAPPGSTNRTVTINIGGKTSSIGVASQNDSDALVGFLRSLESASASAA